mmetsp:Transcript_35405/g.111404  ORF Transcript_35405/g.111404 Transcript_35405/m.111404 type:complete len:231 (+) Transcript_35405:1061-1753(+)
MSSSKHCCVTFLAAMYSDDGTKRMGTVPFFVSKRDRWPSAAHTPLCGARGSTMSDIGGQEHPSSSAKSSKAAKARMSASKLCLMSPMRWKTTASLASSFGRHPRLWWITCRPPASRDAEKQSLAYPGPAQSSVRRTDLVSSSRTAACWAESENVAYSATPCICMARAPMATMAAHSSMANAASVSPRVSRQACSPSLARVEGSTHAKLATCLPMYDTSATQAPLVSAKRS